MKRAMLALRWLVAAGVVAATMFYAGEEVALRYRIAHKTDTVEAVTVYDATKLKNGRYEIFRDQPQTALCVHAILPHLGHRPCWYVRRTRIRVIG